MKMKMKNRSHRYHINRARSEREHKYRKSKKGLNIMMLVEGMLRSIFYIDINTHGDTT